MAVSSMTGFARAAGSTGAWRWAFEIKTVNAKGLDLRLRMPAPFDRVEAEARARLGKALHRGTCFATLAAQREGSATTARIDRAALESITAEARAAAEAAGLAPPTMDGLIALRGVVEIVEAEDDEAMIAAVCAGVLDSLDQTLTALTAARRAEGEALAIVRGAARRGRGARHRPRRSPRRDRSADARRRRQSGPPSGSGASAPGRKRCGADGIGPWLRREPPAPGSVPARRQGRHPRGARPAEDACGRRPRSARRGQIGRAS